MANKWNLEGVAVDTQNNFTATGSVTATGGFKSVVTEYAATGAIDPTDGFVSLDGSASGSMTLAVGADGAEMKIVCINADNTVDVDADFGGTTATITFDVGEACSLISQDSVWYIVGNTGALS
jgi:hypothetical protein